jgi:hypothetical protein
MGAKIIAKWSRSPLYGPATSKFANLSGEKF